jgi:hypothetical protein
MLIQRKTGTTSEILLVFIQDSASTTGAGKTGLLHNSASLTAYYSRSDATGSTSISLVTMTLGTYTSGGFKEVDATNMPGWYQFCPPNGVFTSGRNAAIHLQGASGMAPCVIGIELLAVSNQIAPGTDGGPLVVGSNTVGAGGFAIADGSGFGLAIKNGGEVELTNDFRIGSVVIKDSGTNDQTFNGDQIARIDAAITSRMATYTQPTGFLAATFPTTVASTTNITAGTITTVTNLTNLPTIPANWLTAAGIAADAFTAAKFAADVTTELQAGLATASALSTAQADLTTLTGRLTSTRAGYLDNLSAGAVATAASLTTVAGYFDTEVAAIKTVTDKIDTALVLDGSVYQFTINALENAPSGSGASASAIADAVWDELLSGHTTTGSAGAELTAAASGGGGGDNITVTPLQITAQEIPTYTINGATVWNISAAQNSTQGFLFAVLDGTGTAVNLSAKTLRFVLHSAKAPYAPYGELATSGSGITVGGGSNNQVTVTLTQALTARPFEGAYKLWNITDNVLLGSGSFSIKPAPNDF